MLAIQCHCSEEALLPILVKTLKGNRQFIFAHCVFCGKNITWMNVPEEKIKQDQDVKEVPQGEIKPEEMEWFQKKMKG